MKEVTGIWVELRTEETSRRFTCIYEFIKDEELGLTIG